MADSLVFGGIEYLIPTPRCCHSRNAIQHTPTPTEHSYDRTGCHGNEDNSKLAKDNQTPRHYPGLVFEIMTIPGFSAYLMPESKKVAIQAQISVMRIGANEGGSRAFVCDFVVKDLRAAMRALYAFRGMVLDSV